MYIYGIILLLVFILTSPTPVYSTTSSTQEATECPCVHGTCSPETTTCTCDFGYGGNYCDISIDSQPQIIILLIVVSVASSLIILLVFLILFLTRCRAKI
eukprot:TRINITY_DN11220_c0_g1_i1.p1 TRINITY_DN11220_c0_g1~~TRINITY_DN11220_c0_g1_i1.p1  ORF type:complete len:100 (+),score=6.08 TRINITY_DN11220_c0_g1_i1:16-315(+)